MAGKSCCDYIEISIDAKKRKKYVKYIVKCLKPVADEFDTVIISGYSMATIGSIVADKLNKNLMIVRKDSDEHYSSHKVEGLYNSKCVFIDDLISSGETFNKCGIKAERDMNSKIVGYITYYWRNESGQIEEDYKFYGDVELSNKMFGRMRD